MSDNFPVHAQSALDPDISKHEHEEGASMTPKKIWYVFWVLLGITSIEFIIALILVPRHLIPGGSAMKILIYVTLTLIKAFYIVAYFMHLKFERITLIYTIVVPIVLIIGLITGLLSEGHHWLTVR